jgi:hypothetical protein
MSGAVETHICKLAEFLRIVEHQRRARLGDTAVCFSPDSRSHIQEFVLTVPTRLKFDA